MPQKKRPNTDEIYARSQWSDNMALSREALHESQKKHTRHLPVSQEKPAAGAAHPTSQLKTPPPLPEAPPVGASAPPPAVAKGAAPTSHRSLTQKHPTAQLDHYVSEMNQEINRVSEAVGSRLEHWGDRMADAFRRLLEPLAETLMGLAEALAQAVHTITVGLVKAILQELTVILRTLTDRVFGSNQANSTGSSPPQSTPSPEEDQIPTFATSFGQLLEMRIFFSTIHNRPLLTEEDIRQFQPGNKRQEYEWMKRGLEEIRNCAPYGHKLPTPTKGPFMGIPMAEVLRNVTFSDLENFLCFVKNRPQPFQQKPLKLSEAYATWAHKGAPTR